MCPLAVPDWIEAIPLYGGYNQAVRWDARVGRVVLDDWVFGCDRVAGSPVRKLTFDVPARITKKVEDSREEYHFSCI